MFTRFALLRCYCSGPGLPAETRHHQTLSYVLFSCGDFISLCQVFSGVFIDADGSEMSPTVPCPVLQ